MGWPPRKKKNGNGFEANFRSESVPLDKLDAYQKQLVKDRWRIDARIWIGVPNEILVVSMQSAQYAPKTPKVKAPKKPKQPTLPESDV